MVQTYSDELIHRWNKEIDTYLVYGGLFSAVLTAFNVQSYLLLQPQTTTPSTVPDPTILLLQQISSQLASFSFNPPFLTSTQPPIPQNTTITDIPLADIERWTVCLNAFWFTGLILSLTSASIGITVKQWLNEYTIGVYGNSMRAAQLRQYRLNHLKRWHVASIVMVIPLLLQLALVLFLAGLLVLLWNLHHTVALIISALIGVLGIVIAVVTFLPLYDSTCAYLTPPARLIYAIWEPKHLLYRAITFIAAIFRALSARMDDPGDAAVSTAHDAGAFAPLRRLWKRMSIIRTACRFFHRLESRVPARWKELKPTWSGRERAEINEFPVTLGVDILIEAYNATLSPEALSTATVCLMSVDDEHISAIVDYFLRLHKSVQEHFGSAAAEMAALELNEQQPLWILILLCHLRLDSWLDKEELATLIGYMNEGIWSSDTDTAVARWALTALSAVIERLRETGPTSDISLHVLYRVQRSAAAPHIQRGKIPLESE
ncbi:hypothetical protein BC628DRAFT_1334348 [Trametes gibbosa]|nr:hypothetical protein BC628DRAFT_1334348 [Trametes gibbosa]